MFYHLKFVLVLGLSFFSFFDGFSQESQDKLQNLIEKKREYNKNIKNGYRVILYSGQEEKAKEVYYEFKSEFENIDIQLTYVSPDWKITTLSYINKIEAERVLLIIKEKFPLAKLL